MTKLLQETDPRFYQLQKKVGIFIIASIFLGLALFIGIEQDLLTSQYRLYITAYRGRGITEGMPVKLSGFKIGKVKSVSLDEEGRVKAELAINKKYIKWISKDSIAWLIKEGLFGSYTIEISPGSSRSPRVENRGTLEFDKQKELEDVIEELKPTLEQIKGMISYVNDPQGDIKVTLNNLRRLSGQIFTTRENLDILLKNTNGEIKTLAMELKKTLNEVSQTVKNLDQAVTTVNKDLPKIMSNITKSVDNIERISTELRKAMEQSGDKIPSAITNLESSASDTKEILEGAKRTWPVKNLVTPPKERVIKGDSFE